MDQDTLEILISDFVDDINAGEYPRIFEYIEDHPQHEDMLKMLMREIWDLKIAFNQAKEQKHREN